MHRRHTFFTRHRRTVWALLFILFFSITVSYATPPSSPYSPGETLDPSCAPGDSNCTVQIIPFQTGNNGKFLTTDGTTLSWGIAPSGITSTLQQVLTAGSTLTTPANSGAVAAYIDTDTDYSAYNDSRLLSFRSNGTELMSIRGNGGITIGKNTSNIWGDNNDSLVALHDISQNESADNDMVVGVVGNQNWDTFGYMESYGSNLEWNTFQSAGNGTDSTEFLVKTSYTDADITLRYNQNFLTILNPTSNSLSTPYYFDTSIDHDAGDLFDVRDAGVALFRIDYAGALNFGAYGTGVITGTPAYNLAVDASGNVIEVTGGGAQTFEDVLATGDSFTVNNNIELNQNSLSVNMSNFGGSDNMVVFDGGHGTDFSFFEVQLQDSTLAKDTSLIMYNDGLDLYQHYDSTTNHIGYVNTGITVESSTGGNASRVRISPTHLDLVSTTMVKLDTPQIQFNHYGTGSNTGTATHNLAVDSGGNVIEVGTGGIDDVLSQGQTVTTDRTINAGSHTLNLTSSNGVAGFSVENSNGYAIMAKASGNGYAAGLFENADAVTDDISTALGLLHLTTGTAANGIGTAIVLASELSDGTSLESNRIISKWTDVTSATRTSEFSIEGLNNSVTQIIFALAGSGSLKLNKYGSGAFTGTTAYNLAVDSSGNVIEVTPGGGSTLQQVLTAGSSASISSDLTITNGGGNDVSMYTFRTFYVGTNNDVNFESYSGTDYGGYQLTPSQSKFYTDRATTNTVEPIIDIYRSTSGGTAANGIGASIDFRLEMDSGATVSNQIVSKWTNAANGSETSQFEIWGENNGTLAKKFSIGGNGAIYFENVGTAVSSQDALCIVNGGTEVQRNVGASTCTVSSARFKHDITPLEDTALDTINKLQPSSFVYNGQTNERIGLVAESVNQVEPRLVFYDEDGVTPRGVRYEDLAALSVKAIQELDIKINDYTNLDNPADDTFVNHLRSWFANATNHITRIFTGEVCLTDPDGSSECLNKQELTQLKQLIHQSTATPPAPEDPTPPPADESGDTTSPADEPAPDPAPTTETAPEPETAEPVQSEPSSPVESNTPDVSPTDEAPQP